MLLKYQDIFTFDVSVYNVLQCKPISIRLALRNYHSFGRELRTGRTKVRIIEIITMKEIGSMDNRKGCRLRLTRWAEKLENR